VSFFFIFLFLTIPRYITILYLYKTKRSLCHEV